VNLAGRAEGETTSMRIDRIDHFVLTVSDIDATCAFYEAVLGLEITVFGNGRKALSFGEQKINLHQQGAEFTPHARVPAPGSADFCLTTSVPLEDVIAHLEASGIAIEEGPVARTGARAALRSVYIRDPDGNLVEISNEEGDVP
jgi:catechol 2,3-dioxygenase-like lactoylglutathione lyase family enzyme